MKSTTHLQKEIIDTSCEQTMRGFLPGNIWIATHCLSSIYPGLKYFSKDLIFLREEEVREKSGQGERTAWQSLGKKQTLPRRCVLIRLCLTSLGQAVSSLWAHLSNDPHSSCQGPKAINNNSMPLHVPAPRQRPGYTIKLPSLFLRLFFLMWTIFKVFIEFVTFYVYCLYCFCFMIFWSSGCKACRVLASRAGIKPAPPALEGEVLTTGPLGKSLNSLLW